MSTRAHVKENPEWQFKPDAFDYEPEDARKLWDETFRLGAAAILAALSDDPGFEIGPGEDEAMITLFTPLSETSAPVSDVMSELVEEADMFEGHLEQAKVLCDVLRQTASELEEALTLLNVPGMPMTQVKRNALRYVFRHANSEDWECLLSKLGDGDRDKFWKAIFGGILAALKSSD